MRQLLTGLAQDIASLAIELLGLLHRATASWFFHPFYKVIVRTFPGLPSLLPLPVRMSLPQLATVEILSPLVSKNCLMAHSKECLCFCPYPLCLTYRN